MLVCEDADMDRASSGAVWAGLSNCGQSCAGVDHNMWTIRHLGVMANGALALGSWITLLMGKPFTLEYARVHTDPANGMTRCSSGSTYC